MNQPLQSAQWGTGTPQALLESLAAELDAVVLGKREQVRLALTCLVARGHLLIEDIPGVGKTALAECLARSFSLSFARVPFTSDLLPSDIIGAQVFKQTTGTFEFHRGPIFHHVVLADELNRAPPRTQSALLEAMAQSQLSVDGVTFALPEPFVVIATQNPTDLAGTYALPDSQLDRFLFRISLGHLAPEIEAKLLTERRGPPRNAAPAVVANPSTLLSLQRAADDVTISDDVAAYAVQLGGLTRNHPDFERGSSTRAMLSLMAAARANALWHGRTFVVPSDIGTVFGPTLAHRLVMRSSSPGSQSRDDVGRVLASLVASIPPPR